VFLCHANALSAQGSRVGSQRALPDRFAGPLWGCDNRSLDDQQRYDPRERFIDVAHPKYFTRVVEVTASGHRRPVFSYWTDTTATVMPLDANPLPNPSGQSSAQYVGDREMSRMRRRTCERVNADVDVRSRIVVEFDRTWLIDQEVEANMTVSGNLQTGSSAPRIEIPGYSEVGKDIAAAATVHQGAKVAALTSEFLSSWTDAQKQLDSIRAQADLASQIAKETGVHAAIVERDAALRQINSLQKAFLDTSRRALLDTVAVRSSLHNAAVRLDSADTRLQRARHTPRYLQAIDTTYVIAARRLLSLRRAQLETPLKPLADTASQFILRALAQQGNADAATAQMLVRQLASVFDAIARPLPAVGNQTFGARAAEVTDSIEKLVVLLNGLARFAESGGGTRSGHSWFSSFASNDRGGRKPYSFALVADLRDVEVLLSQVGAKAGESIVLHIADSVPGSSGRRQLDVRLRVRELGLVRRISDAVLLLHRRGVGDGYVDPRVVAAREEFRRTGRADPVAEVALPANFIPAAGATLSWTHYQRSGGGWRSALDLLTPGFGISVLFTAFPSQTMSFGKPDSTGAPPRETVTVSQDKVQVAAGPVITLFDNALVLGAGWNLNVSQRRFYSAIGFSFVNIAKRLGMKADDPAPQ
jgi:hypothetical protein